MRILYVNPAVYDFLTATIIEGLNELATEFPIELITTHWSNYSKRGQVWPKKIIYQNRNSFDLTILGTNDGVDNDLYWSVARKGRTICIDGADFPEFVYPPENFDLYYKREL